MATRRARRRASQTVRALLASRQTIRIEIGAGIKNRLKGWTTIDRNLDCDICCNLEHGIPFPTATVDCIYSSHLLEHMAYPEISQLLADCYRALKPGGLISISVPDAEHYITAYVQGVNFSDSVCHWAPGLCDTGSPIDQVNYIAYMGGHHKYMFDKQNLIRLLLMSGFRDATLRGFDPSLDLPERDFESIYAEASKPCR
jgi:predicted SAM-dependent methyltransferase